MSADPEALARRDFEAHLAMGLDPIREARHDYLAGYISVEVLEAILYLALLEEEGMYSPEGAANGSDDCTRVSCGPWKPLRGDAGWICEQCTRLYLGSDEERADRRQSNAP